ncbi:MAG: DUF1833 family protein [Janthinobacterium lividum]
MTSASFNAKRQRVSDPDGVLELLTISHASFSGPAHIVNDTRNWISGGVTYVALPFRFTYPQDVAGESPKSTIEIDNVGRDLTAELERLPPSAVVMATIMLVDRASPNVIEWQWTVPMTNVSANAALITATLGVDFLMRQQAVRLRHDPNTSPGIFQD